jgi:hypothetical protein
MEKKQEFGEAELIHYLHKELTDKGYAVKRKEVEDIAEICFDFIMNTFDIEVYLDEEWDDEDEW